MLLHLNTSSERRAASLPLAGFGEPHWLHEWHREHSETRRLILAAPPVPARWRAQLDGLKGGTWDATLFEHISRARSLRSRFYLLGEHRAATFAGMVLRASKVTMWRPYYGFRLWPPTDEIAWRLSFLEALHTIRAGHRRRRLALSTIAQRLAQLGMVLDAGLALDRARRRARTEQVHPDASTEHSLPRETRAGPGGQDDDPHLPVRGCAA